MTDNKAIEVTNKIQLSDNPLWLEVKRLACDYEKQIAIDAEHITALQKTNGSLTDRVNELEKSLLDVSEKTVKQIAEFERKLEQAEKDLSDYQFNYPTIKELQKENAELTCQMKRNTYCYSCTNATEKCYRKEIGCPCGDYKYYKDEITELRKLKRDCETSLCRAEYQWMYERFAKAKDLLAKWVELYNPKLEGFSKPPILIDTEKFLKESE